MTYRTVRTLALELLFFFAWAVVGGLVAWRLGGAWSPPAAADVEHRDLKPDSQIHAVVAPCDPVVDADQAATAPPKTRWQRAKATLRAIGRNTGGAPLVFAIGGLLVLVRRRWPRARRGWVGRASAGGYAAAIWAGASLELGATWATAITGVIVSLVTGVAWASIPGERRDLEDKDVAGDETPA